MGLSNVCQPHLVYNKIMGKLYKNVGWFVVSEATCRVNDQVRNSI